MKHGLMVSALLAFGCHSGQQPAQGGEDAGSSSTRGAEGSGHEPNGTDGSNGSGGEATTALATGDTGKPTGDDTGASSTGAIDPSVEVWEVRMDDFSPPATSTWYACEAWTFFVDAPVHIVGFRPRTNDPHVHHYVVQMFDHPVDADPASSCLEPPFDSMVWGWAPGGEELMLPEDVGIPAGDSGVISFRVQIHYNNPLADTFTDNGGFDVLYTKDLRPNEADVFTTGTFFGGQIPGGAFGLRAHRLVPSPSGGRRPGNGHRGVAACPPDRQGPVDRGASQRRRRRRDLA